MKLSIPKRWWARFTLIIVALIVIPYVFSRVMSVWRCVTIHSANELSTEAMLDTSRLRIACYNIAHGRGLSRSNWTGETQAERLHRLDEIGDLLRELDADVVVLNEVDFETCTGLFQRMPMRPPTNDGNLTFPSVHPRSVIDWVLIPRDWHLNLYHIEPSILSDHRPVLAEFRYGMGDQIQYQNRRRGAAVLS